MSSRTVLAALVAAAFVISMPVTGAYAQTATTSAPTKEEKAAQKKARAEASKARKAEKTVASKAAHDRQKQCGAEWKKLRADGKVEKGMSWPRYYSACNKRLKAA